MALRRRFRRRRYGRRRGRMPRGTRRRSTVALRLARIINKQRMREMKVKSFSLATTTIGAAYTLNTISLTDIAEGTDWDERTGDRITLHSIDLFVRLRCVHDPAGSYVNYRLTGAPQAVLPYYCTAWVGVVRCMENDTAAPNINTLFNVQQPRGQTRSLNNYPDWKILWSRNILFRVQNQPWYDGTTYTYYPHDPKVYRVRIPVRGLGVRYNGALGSDSGYGTIWLCSYINTNTAAGTNGVLMGYSYRMRWHG